MRIPLAFAFLSLAFSSCSTPPEPATKLEKAAVLPLELNDRFQFRKIQQAYFTADPAPITQSEPVNFERQRLRWGAVDRYQLEKRYGNYYTFFWRTSERADVAEVADDLMQEERVAGRLLPQRPCECRHRTLGRAGLRLLHLTCRC